MRVRISTGSLRPAPVAEPETPSEPEIVQSSNRPTSSDISEVRNRYEQWLSAWRSMNLDDFMSYYSPRVRQKRAHQPSHGYSKMRQRLGDHWSTISYINISSAEPSIEVSGNQLVLEAFQEYKDSKVGDKGIKRQVWTKEDGRWVIIAESFIDQS